MPARLGVNIDHVATLRQARMGREPDPVAAAVAAELGGADNITVHLREDRRHIQERDVRILRETVGISLNLEMAATREVIAIALSVMPDQVTFVPEKRKEITTEGGLDVAVEAKFLAEVVERFREKKIRVSLFVDPDRRQLEAAKMTRADAVEIHTGEYANARGDAAVGILRKIGESVVMARNMRLKVHAGHGLNYRNIGPLSRMPEIEEFNIGHSIVSRAVFTGLEGAVREMKHLLR